jgi:hypothetical protein
MDNVFIERLWRSLKHEDIYLRGYKRIALLERFWQGFDTRLDTPPISCRHHPVPA